MSAITLEEAEEKYRLIYPHGQTTDPWDPLVLGIRFYAGAYQDKIVYASDDDGWGGYTYADHRFPFTTVLPYPRVLRRLSYFYPEIKRQTSPPLNWPRWEIIYA